VRSLPDVPELKLIIPSAFYALSLQRPRHPAYGTRTERTLDPDDVRRLVAGRHALHQLVSQPMLLGSYIS
jgi:hypothetical protein